MFSSSQSICLQKCLLLLGEVLVLASVVLLVFYHLLSLGLQCWPLSPDESVGLLSPYPSIQGDAGQHPIADSYFF